MTKRVWLPFEDEAAAVAAIGPLPDGVAADYYRAGELPSTVAEVEFLVAPYMAPPLPLLERIAEMTSLRAIQLQSAGYDNYLPFLRPGMALSNAAGVHDTATAELAVALALVNLRKLDRFARNMPEGRWQLEVGESLADKRVLIVGYGRIGAAIERRLAGFEVASVARVARSSRTEPEVHPVGELRQQLAQADVVFLITPLTPQTEGLIGAAELAAMPDGALLVNASRGKVVDTEALVDAVRDGRIRASLDVTDPEPLPPDHPLWTMPGVFVSPHVGGQADAFHPRIHRLLKEQLARFAAGDPLVNVVSE
ncbi:MAG: 2-hydroxyacid dehydrogenase [Propionicimonas sp.]|nr:2-hydroxyacid dehydrogenase [Propionicimonas sp.]